jgi:hypothetical protein
VKPVNKNEDASISKEMGQLPSKNYEELCAVINPEWYNLQKYALLLKSKDDRPGAILYSCRAALAGKQIFEKINLFEELGNLFSQAGKTKWARDHYSLCVAIREKKCWKVSRKLKENLQERNKEVNDDIVNDTYETSIVRCKKIWHSIVNEAKQ